MAADSQWRRQVGGAYRSGLSDAPAHGTSQTRECSDCCAIGARGDSARAPHRVCICPYRLEWWVRVCSSSHFIQALVERSDHIADDAHDHIHCDTRDNTS